MATRNTFHLVSPDLKPSQLNYNCVHHEKLTFLHQIQQVLDPFCFR